ncbi:MAG: LicD family protein [Ruminococcus sp.]|nr:LicD family protein [Ruminococcus sp.]
MADNKLRTLQLCILDIALEFKRICDKHNINYFLIGGSLLGAVRHKGFIPWDDDMDMGMLRDDYEKFIKIAKKELRPGFFLQTYKTDPYFGHGFFKIRIDNTILLEDYAEHSKQHNGIYLDVFPYDVMPDNRMALEWQHIRYRCLKWAAMVKTDYNLAKYKKQNYFSLFMSKVLFFYSKKDCIDRMQAVCTEYQGKKNRNIINWFGPYRCNEYMPVKCVRKLTLMEFEGYLFKAPANYDILLRHMYGDYMQLPPVEKRGKQHSMIKIDFGDYKPHNIKSKEQEKK